MTEKKFDDRERGVLFKNDRKENANQPDYRGSINVNGHDYWLSAWIKEGRNGKFMSLSVKQKDGNPPRSSPNPEPKASAARSVAQEMDDEIPF